MYVGGLEDGIDDSELHQYFSEFGFVTRALRYKSGLDGSPGPSGRNHVYLMYHDPQVDLMSILCTRALCHVYVFTRALG